MIAEKELFELKLNLKLIEIIKRSTSVTSFRLSKPENFDYLPGQYVLVGIDLDNEYIRKPLTLSSSPTDEKYIEFTKKLTGHDFSNGLASLNLGDTLVIEGPYGNMYYDEEESQICLISGGIGITPMISICKYCSHKKLSTEIVLIGSYKHETDRVFRHDFEDLQKENSNLKVIDTLTRPEPSWNGYKGRICENIIKNEVPNYLNRIYYLCGPPPMVNSVEKLLIDIGLSKKQIKKEVFIGY